MFSLSAAALRALAIVSLLVFCALDICAQCPPPDLDVGIIPKIPLQKPVREEPILPEAGFLSNTHYTSQFFGFAFDLPLSVKGHEIMMPVMPEKEHALLALQYEEGQHKGYIMVTAYDPVRGFDANTPEEKENQRELEKWAAAGTPYGGLPQNNIPQFLLHSDHFHREIRRRGRNYAAQYWTAINNYTVKVVVVTNDELFLHKAKDDMADVQFYCPQDDGTLINANGKTVKVQGEPYAGPTVPTFRVNAALHDEPSKNIPPGEVAGGVYRNSDIGLQYELPQGWQPIASDASDPPLEPTALREYQFLYACSRKLLELAPQTESGANGHLDSTIVLRALDPNCLAMRTAASLTDKRATDEVAASFEQLGEFGEIGSDELMSISGHLFMVFHGTIATAVRSQELAKRLSQTIFATRYHKLLLVWSFMAPNSVALEAMPTGGILLEGAPPIQLRTAKREKGRSTNP